MKIDKNKLISLLIKLVLLIMGLTIATLIIRKIKYSDFMQTLNQTPPIETPSASKHPSETYSARLDAFAFQQDNTGTREIGVPQNITEDGANTYCTVNYPVIGMASIDDVLKNDVDSIINTFNTEYADYIAPTPETRAYLSIDYQSYLTGDSIASFVYNIQYDSPKYANPVTEIHTHVFLLATGVEVSYDQLLTGDYLKLFSFRTEQYVKANPQFAEAGSVDKYAKGYTADASNFQYFTLSMQGLTLYFDPYTIAPGEFGCLSFTIPATEILPYLIFDPFIQVTVPVANDPVPSPEPTNAPYAVDPSKPMVALTFDDGPNTETTSRILDVLEANNCHATFFLVGNRISRNEEVVKRAYEMGCDLGNHTFNHARLLKMKKKNIKKEIEKTNDVLKKLIGTKANFVRTPYGDHTKHVLDSVKYPIILWDIDTEDWASHDKKKISKKVIGKVKDGDIILMHDLYKDTAAAVEIIVPKLIKEGFQIVSISEMFQAKGKEPKKGTAYYNVQ